MGEGTRSEGMPGRAARGANGRPRAGTETYGRRAAARSEEAPLPVRQDHVRFRDESGGCRHGFVVGLFGKLAAHVGTIHGDFVLTLHEKFGHLPAIVVPREERPTHGACKGRYLCVYEVTRPISDLYYPDGEWDGSHPC